MTFSFFIVFLNHKSRKSFWQLLPILSNIRHLCIVSIQIKYHNFMNINLVSAVEIVRKCINKYNEKYVK